MYFVTGYRLLTYKSIAKHEIYKSTVDGLTNTGSAMTLYIFIWDSCCYYNPVMMQCEFWVNIGSYI